MYVYLYVYTYIRIYYVIWYMLFHQTPLPCPVNQQEELVWDVWECHAFVEQSPKLDPQNILPKYPAESNKTTTKQQGNQNGNQNGTKTRPEVIYSATSCKHATLIHFVQAAQPGDCPGSPASHAVHANSPGKSGLPVVTRGNCTQIIVMGRILVDCPGVRFLCQFGKCPDVLCTCQLYDTTFLGGWLQLFLTNKVGQEFLEFFTQNMFGLNFHIADWKESALHSAAAFESFFQRDLHVLLQRAFEMRGP